MDVETCFWPTLCLFDSPKPQRHVFRATIARVALQSPGRRARLAQMPDFRRLWAAANARPLIFAPAARARPRKSRAHRVPIAQRPVSRRPFRVPPVRSAQILRYRQSAGRAKRASTARRAPSRPPPCRARRATIVPPAHRRARAARQRFTVRTPTSRSRVRSARFAPPAAARSARRVRPGASAAVAASTRPCSVHPDRTA